jgi:hypothetical protein
MRSSTIVVALAALLATSASAEDRTLISLRRNLDKKDDVDDFKRKLKFEVKDDQVKIDAKSDFKAGDKRARLKDSIDFDIKTNNGDGLKVDLQYKYENQTDGSKEKYQIKYAFKVSEIVEFEPTDISKGFQEGVDKVMQTLDLKDWSDMQSGKEVVKTVDVDTFTTSASSGVFTSKGYISTQTLNDFDYSSNYIKFDFDIDNFPYKGKAGTTALALATKIEGKFKSQTKESITTPTGKKEYNYKIENEGQSADAVSPIGRFSWVKTALAGNKTVNVISSTKADGNGKYFWFTFDTTDQVTSIAWDPEIGVEYPGDNGAATASISALALIAAAMINVFN